MDVTHRGKTMLGQGKKASVSQREKSNLPTPVLGLLLPELSENTFLLFKPPSLWCSVIVALANSYIQVYCDLFVTLLMGTWVVSSLQLLQIKLLRKFMHKSL